MLEKVFKHSKSSSAALKEEEKALLEYVNSNMPGITHESSRSSYAVRRYVFSVENPNVIRLYRTRDQREILNLVMKTRGDAECTVERDEGKLVISVPRKDKKTLWLGDGIEYLQSIQKKKNELICYVGEREDGKPAIVDFVTNPHWMVAGYTGSGKSVCLNNMLFTLLDRYADDELHIYIADDKASLTHMDGIKQVKMQADNPQDILAMFIQLKSILTERKGQLNGQKIETYNKTHKERMPRIIVFFDEADSIIGRNTATSKVISDQVRSIVRQLVSESRYAGIHLVLASQKPAGVNIDTTIKSNIAGRIALKVANKSDSRVVMDEKGAEALLGDGDAYMLQEGSAKARIQCAYASDDEIKLAKKELTLSP